MKIITLQQPWAPAVVFGRLDVINHHHPTNYRGQLLIHAGRVDRHFPRQAPPGTNAQQFFNVAHSSHDEYAGMVLGVVELHGVAELDECQLPFAAGPYVWLTRNPRVFARPVALRGSYDGATGLPLEIRGKLLAHLAAAVETAVPAEQWLLSRDGPRPDPETVYEPRGREPHGGTWRGD